MFLPSSRYADVRQEQTSTREGRVVSVVSLRRLPPTGGEPTVVKTDERLDVTAQRLYEDSTRFWHVADANTELRANDLVKEVGRVIEVPDQ